MLYQVPVSEVDSHAKTRGVPNEKPSTLNPIGLATMKDTPSEYGSPHGWVYISSYICILVGQEAYTPILFTGDIFPS